MVHCKKISITRKQKHKYIVSYII